MKNDSESELDYDESEDGTDESEPGTDGKPRCQLVGTDGSVFALAGEVRKALREAGQREKAEEFTKRVFQCSSYDDALILMLEYVDAY